MVNPRDIAGERKKMESKPRNRKTNKGLSSHKWLWFPIWTDLLPSLSSVVHAAVRKPQPDWFTVTVSF